MRIAGLWSLAERIARYAWLPYLILLIAPLAGHLAAVLTGLSSNPMVFDSSVTQGGGGNLIAGMTNSDSNVGWTNQALGHLAAEQWLHGIIPWWNPYTGIGLPLAGEMQPAALFLPFVLLLIFQNGLLWLIWIMQALAGIACFALLRKLGLRRWTALIGGLLYLYSGTFAWMPGETILNVVPFLPVLLLGIETAREPASRAAAIILVAIGIGWSLLGGFPETAYVDGLMAFIWALARLPGTQNRLSYSARIVAGGVTGLLIAAPAIIAFLDFSRQSDVFASHLMGLVALNIRGLGPVFMPYVFGPLGNNLGNGLLLTISAGTAGYLGAMILPFAFSGVVSRRFPILQAALSVWFLLCMAKTFGFHPVMAAMNALPFMKQVEFLRYSSASWELAVIVVAMIGLEDLSIGRHRWRIPMLASLLVLLVSVALVWPWSPEWHWHQPDLSIMVRWFLRGIVFALAGLAAVLAVNAWLPVPWRRFGFGALLVANAFVFFSVPQLSGQRAWRIDWPAIHFLHRHLGLGRFYTVGPIAPNYSAYFDLPSINDNYLPLADSWARYVITHLYTGAAVYQGGIFWPPFHPPVQSTDAIAELRRFMANFQAIGVNYIVTYPGMSMRHKRAIPAAFATAMPLPLYAGDHLTLSEPAPEWIAQFSPVAWIGIDDATYSGSADGRLTLTLCAAGQCASGSGSLRGSPDNSPFWVKLDRPVPLASDQPYRLTVTHKGGSHPNAIWLMPSENTGRILTTNTHGKVAGMTAQVLFASGPPPSALTKVYSDQIMDIWHLSGAKPYYTLASGACTLSDIARRTLTADCQGKARLIRRELFMPGWHAEIDGKPATIDPVDGLMQAVALPSGHNRVRFYFRPPFIAYAWAGFWFGLAALALEAVLALNRRRRRAGAP